MATLYYVNNGTGYSLSSGGTGDQAVTAFDVLRYDGNSPDDTLTADRGSVSVDGNGVATISPWVLGIICEAAYVNTIAAVTYDLAIGTGGFDASAADNMTFNMGSGAIACDGDFSAHLDTVWQESTSTLIMCGGTPSTRLILSLPYRGGGGGGGAVQVNEFILAAGAFITITDIPQIRGFSHWYGDAIIQSAVQASVEPSVFHVDAVTSGGVYNASGQDLTITTPSQFSSSVRLYGGGTLYGAGILAGLMTFQNSVGDTQTRTVATGFDFTDIQYSYTTANAMTVVFNDNEIHGDISETGVTGTMAASGSIIYAGSADQSDDSGQLTTQPLKSIEKTAGDLELISGGVTLGGDSSCDSIVADAGFSDIFVTDGFDLTTTGGAYFGQGLVSFDNGSQIIGGDDYYGDDQAGGDNTLTLDSLSVVKLGYARFSDQTDTDAWLLAYTVDGQLVEPPTLSTTTSVQGFPVTRETVAELSR